MGRAPCCDKANVKRGPWSPEEDAKLKEYMEKNGTGGNWIALPQKAGLRRCGKSCRLRWLNYLRPNIRHGEFTDDEDRIICSLFASIGSRWSIIASQLPGRTDNDIKNYWNTKLRKKLMGMAPFAQHHKIPHPISTNVHNSLLQNSSMPPQLSSLNSNMSSSYEFGNYMSFSRGYDPLSPSFTTQIVAPNSSQLMQLQDGNFNMVNDSNNSNILKFGGETRSSSSDGSCITTTNTCENLGMQTYFNTGVDEYQNFLISASTNCGDEKAAVGNGCFSENPLDFGIEEIKQLIGTNNMCSNNLSFYLDEIKTEDINLYHDL